MKVKIFISKDCPKCPAAKVLGEELKKGGVMVEYYDVGISDGLTEAAYYGIMSTPSIVICDKDGLEVKSFIGKVPMIEMVMEIIKKDIHIVNGEDFIGGVRIR